MQSHFVCLRYQKEVMSIKLGKQKGQKKTLCVTPQSERAGQLDGNFLCLLSPVGIQGIPGCDNNNKSKRGAYTYYLDILFLPLVKGNSSVQGSKASRKVHREALERATSILIADTYKHVACLGGLHIVCFYIQDICHCESRQTNDTFYSKYVKFSKLLQT